MARCCQHLLKKQVGQIGTNFLGVKDGGKNMTSVQSDDEIAFDEHINVEYLHLS